MGRKKTGGERGQEEKFENFWDIERTLKRGTAGDQ